MFSKVDYVMINTSDMKRSIAFYRDALGLPLKFETPEWSEFDTGGTTVALHPGSAASAGAATQAGPAAGTCTLGFSVQDLDHAFAELSRRGVRFVMPPTLREGEGIRLAVCLDPDGLAISLAEAVKK